MATNHEVGSSNLSGRANFPKFSAIRSNMFSAG